jgi:hypothetical protein
LKVHLNSIVSKKPYWLILVLVALITDMASPFPLLGNTEYTTVFIIIQGGSLINLLYLTFPILIHFKVETISLLVQFKASITPPLCITLRLKLSTVWEVGNKNA